MLAHRSFRAAVALVAAYAVALQVGLSVFVFADHAAGSVSALPTALCSQDGSKADGPLGRSPYCPCFASCGMTGFGDAGHPRTMALPACAELVRDIFRLSMVMALPPVRGGEPRIPRAPPAV